MALQGRLDQLGRLLRLLAPREDLNGPAEQTGIVRKAGDETEHRVVHALRRHRALHLREVGGRVAGPRRLPLREHALAHLALLHGERGLVDRAAGGRLFCLQPEDDDLGHHQHAPGLGRRGRVLEGGANRPHVGLGLLQGRALGLGLSGRGRRLGPPRSGEAGEGDRQQDAGRQAARAHSGHLQGTPSPFL